MSKSYFTVSLKRRTKVLELVDCALNVAGPEEVGVALVEVFFVHDVVSERPGFEGVLGGEGGESRISRVVLRRQLVDG